MKRDLSRLLRPQSIALFGGDWAENVSLQLQKSGFAGEIWPVHPKRKEISGIPCFASIDDLPSPPDASFVGVNRNLTIEVVRRLSEMGAGGATCFASGFLESDQEDKGGGELQEALVAAAGDMPIIGPNCYGLINYLDNVTLWPDQHGGRACDRGVAVIGQSSNILINMTMQQRALPIAYALAAGNQAQTSLSDLALATMEDDRVTAIGLYIEGFGSIRAFEAMAARARELGKPMVAIKSGKSEKSREATMSHTASLAGTAAASSALLRRLGIAEVGSMGVFLETLKLLHMFGPLKGNSISSLSCSGGEAGLISDMAEGTGICFRELSEKAHARLKAVLGPIVKVTNPLDYQTFIWGEADKLEQTYAAVFDDNYDLNVLIMDIPPTKRCDPAAWQGPLEAAISAAKNTGAKVAFHATLPENLSEEISDRLLKHGIVPMHGMEEMIPAIDAAIIAGKLIAPNNQPVIINPSSNGGAETRVLDEAVSKAALAPYGLAFPKSVQASNSHDLHDLLQSLQYPLVLKGLGIAHKSEAGAVVLNLQTPEAVINAAEAMKGINGFLAEEMICGGVTELIIGVTRDETGLLLLTIGAGGVLTELLQDSASMLVPSSRQDIENALASLRINALLEGYRGKSVAHRASIIDAIEAVQAYCLANPHVIELDINPLIALPGQAVAVDALIKLETL